MPMSDNSIARKKQKSRWLLKTREEKERQKGRNDRI